MLGKIKHGINLVKHAFRDVGIGAKRSPQWHTVEKHFLEQHPTCAACGTTKRLNVHHCIPFHHNASLELEPSNLITLCMSVKECHVHIGHGGRYSSFVPNVRHLAAQALANPQQFEEIVKQAMQTRKDN